MIFYNQQLMKDSSELALFVVSNPDKFDRFEDHRAAIELRVDELVEQAIVAGEDPIQLIEAYLNVTYLAGPSPAEIADFIIQSEAMMKAINTLHINWSTFDETKPESTLRLISTTTQAESVETYSEMTLRGFLEALSNHFSH